MLPLPHSLVSRTVGIFFPSGFNWMNKRPDKKDHINMKARFENHQPRSAKGSSLPNNTQSNPRVLAVPSNACGIHADDKHQETAKGCERQHGTQKAESGKQPTSSRCEQNGYKQEPLWTSNCHNDHVHMSNFFGRVTVTIQSATWGPIGNRSE